MGNVPGHRGGGPWTGRASGGMATGRTSTWGPPGSTSDPTTTRSWPGCGGTHRSSRPPTGWWPLSRYEDVRDVSRDPGRFVSGRGVLINDPLRDVDSGGLGAFSILHLDPPIHAAYRSVVNRLFTPRSVAPLEARIRDVVRAGARRRAHRRARRPGRRAGRAHPPGRDRRAAGGRRRPTCEQLRRWSDATIESADGSSGRRGRR